MGTDTSGIYQLIWRGGRGIGMYLLEESRLLNILIPFDGLDFSVSLLIRTGSRGMYLWLSMEESKLFNIPLPFDCLNISVSP